MPDRVHHAQPALLSERHWYALISAAPVPENGEAVNVGLVFGNGRAYHLDFIDSLPRLRCLVAPGEIGVYAAVLEGCKEKVERGIELVELSSLLGPQLFVQPVRELYVPIEDRIVEQLRRRFLASPQGERVEDEAALIRRSRHRLDRSLRQTSFPASLIARDVGPAQLFEGTFKGLTGHRVPRLSRALRGHGRDVLVDSVSIERGYEARAIREVASRITQAFFVYDRHRESIRLRTGRELRTTGILYEPPADASADLIDLYDFTRKSWIDQSARVVTGSDDEIREQLQEDADWVRSV